MKYNKSLYPFQSRWLEIDGHRIHYIDEGKGQTILFSHAPLGSSFMYRNFIRILSKRYRCIALDYPGFGLSSDLPDRAYSIATQARVLRSFVHALKLQDLIGLGHDTGGPSLFYLASEEPWRFKGLILTDTLIFPTHEYTRIHRLLRVVGSRFFQSLNAWTNLLVRLTFSLGVPTRKLSREEIKQYRDLYASGAKRRRITEMLYSLRENEGFMEKVKRAFQQQLNQLPTLLIYGEKDPVTEMGIPQRIHSMLKHSELYLIKGEGHFPHEGQAEQMCEIMLKWMAGLERISAGNTKADEASLNPADVPG